jgi:hypothetical protein
VHRLKAGIDPKTIIDIDTDKAALTKEGILFVLDAFLLCGKFSSLRRRERGT